MDNRSAIESLTLNALRIVTGFLFWQHGAQKLLGWLGGDQVGSVLSLLGVAGVLELFGGILIAVGLFTRPVAFILAGEMAVAYFVAHFGAAETLMGRLFPIMNGGERAVLFCFVFLLLTAFGPGRFSLDGWMRSRGSPAV
ncbi:MAG: DoxX family protein [Longimicrobiales bacterium]|nr:DoxX family protein [Longimicrobiales bacterium]